MALDLPFSDPTPVQAVESCRYRSLLIGLDGKRLRERPLFAKDDEDATRIAKAMVDGRPVELWDGTRFIGRFEPGAD